MDFPRWLPTLVVLATLATLAFAALAEQWLLVTIALVILLIEVFMSGPVELESPWLRLTGYLHRSPVRPLRLDPTAADDPDAPASDRQRTKALDK